MNGIERITFNRIFKVNMKYIYLNNIILLVFVFIVRHFVFVLFRLKNIDIT